MSYDPTQPLGARLHYAYREAMGHLDREQSLYARFPAEEQAFWDRAAVNFVARLSDAPTEASDIQGRMRGLADRLDDISERCAARASKYGHPGALEDLTNELLARATTYQECAGLIREALK